MDCKEKIDILAEEFKGCQKIMNAIGDANRQYLLLEMMQMGECGGVRVGQITERTNLSRPAVSHHLQILKDAGIIKVRKEGTKNYYFFDTQMEAFEKLIHMLELAKNIAGELPERSEK